MLMDQPDITAPLVQPPDLAPPQADPTREETAHASFYNQNDLTNLDMLLKKPALPSVKDYALSDDLKSKGLWPDKDLYVDSQSPAETDWITQKTAEDRKLWKKASIRSRNQRRFKMEGM